MPEIASPLLCCFLLWSNPLPGFFNLEFCAPPNDHLLCIDLTELSVYSFKFFLNFFFP